MSWFEINDELGNWSDARVVRIVCTEGGHRQFLAVIALKDWTDTGRGKPYVQLTGPGMVATTMSQRIERNRKRPLSDNPHDYRRQMLGVYCRKCHGRALSTRVGHSPARWSNATLTAAVTAILDAHPTDRSSR